MRVVAIVLFLIFSVFSPSNTWAQADSSKIYQIAERMPLFPGCDAFSEEVDRRACSDKSVLQYAYQYLVYPTAAREAEMEGMVVIKFVVEKDGKISGAKVVKDIGGGCGEEALRVVNLMNELDRPWVPGQQGGEAVRVEYNLPIRFKIPREPEFYVEGRDTVWIKYDEAPVFAGGMEALDKYLISELKYPKGGIDTCAIGIVECSTLVRSNGQVVVLETKDYNNLGFDYEYEATRTIISSMKHWTPAVYNGKNVSAAYDIRLAFKPRIAACQTQLDNFDKAYGLAEEGAKLFEAKSVEEAITKYDAAVALFPENAEFLILRGQAYLDLKRMPEACEDLQKVKNRLIKTVYNNILPMICIE